MILNLVFTVCGIVLLPEVYGRILGYMTLLILEMKSELEAELISDIENFWNNWNTASRKAVHVSSSSGSNLVSLRNSPCAVVEAAIVQTDGAFPHDLDSGGCGWDIRDSNKNFIQAGADRNYKPMSAIHQEALAVLKGLEVVKELNLSKVKVESDCKVLIDALNSPKEDLSELGSIKGSIKRRLIRAWGQV
ncbi:hypothetical protein RIF29_14907 [Crotalaria pallida]|uniref:RNase H type-1 domain-containing protein n=1 Tax=Crotalaria pallida TaxID=3830 RepID=A0AAN9FKY4_CROPI